VYERTKERVRTRMLTQLLGLRQGRGQQVGEPYRALQAFRSMQQAGLEPSLSLWANVISLLCRQNGPRRVSPCDRWAFELWDELHSSGMRLDAPAIATGTTLPLEEAVRKEDAGRT
jgi:hypothetical protein